MSRISEFALHGLGNAAWQIAAVVAVASICARLLRNATPRYRHALWVAALFLSLALPLWTLSQLEPASPQLSRDERQPASIPSNENPGSSPTTASLPSPVTAKPEPSSRSLDGLLQTLRQPVVASSSLARCLALAYALFLAYRLASLGRAWLRAQAFRRSAHNRELPRFLVTVSARCQAAFGLKDIPLLFSASACSPATVGAWKPVIVLPESFYEAASEETLATMVGHEMAHIKRRDYALNLLYQFLLLPISFHPLAIVVMRQIGRTRELACDDLVTERLLEPRTYARSLLQVAGTSVFPAGQPLTLGVFDADILEERIMKLTQARRPIGTRAGRLLAVGAFSLLCLTCIAASTFSFDLRTDSTDEKRHVGFAIALTNETQHEGQAAGKPESSSQNPAKTPEERVGLLQQLKSANPEVRAEAACQIGKSHVVEAIPLLVAMLGDDAPTQSIRCWDQGRWNPALDSFKHPSPGEQAAIALASMGTPAFEPLTTALSDSNSSVRRNAAWAIGELTNMRGRDRASAVPALIALLDDSDEWVRRAAARSLGEIRDERATDGLIAHLSDHAWRVRDTAAWSLGEMKENRAVEALCRLIQSDSQFEVRKTTAWALAEIQDKRAVETLCNVLQADTHAEVRATTAWALGETKDKRAIDSLSNALLTDGEAEVRKTAAWALGEIQSRKALAVLKQALSDPDERVRAKVRWALSEVEDNEQ